MLEEALPIKRGQLIGGRYRVERVVGKGGMGVVIAARHEDLDELVAIKILLPHRLENEGLRARFAVEARAAVKIKSEHVARVMDVGALEDGTPYMVMEYLEGEDLATLLSRRHRVPAPEAVHYVLQVCDALREAHSLGIIHRDVKPANLFLAKSRGRPPRLKVLDFGISKVEKHDRRRTDTKEIMGSPWYMAPEQMKSATSADARSDIWSVGIILFELVTGEVPFDGESMTEVIVKVLHDPAPLDSRPELPDALTAVIRRCLSKSPAERYANMDELAAALRALEMAPPARKASRAPASAPAVLLGVEDVELVSDAEPRGPHEESEVIGGEDAEIVDDEGDDDAETTTVEDAELLSAETSDRAEDDLTTPIAPAVDPDAPAPGARTTTRPKAPRGPADERAAPRASAAGRNVLPLVAAAAAVLVVSWAVVKWPGARPDVSTGQGPASAPSNEPAASATSMTPPPASETAQSTEPAPPSAVIVAAIVEETAPVAASRRDVVRVAMPASSSAKAAEDDDATVAFQASRRYYAAVRETCWEPSEKSTSVVTVSVSVDPSGSVSGATASAADPSLAQCVQGQARSWTFPPSTSARSLQIPIRFRR